MSIFNSIRIKKPKSSFFNLSHERKLTMKMGDLVPIFMSETLPGDKFTIRLEQLVRMQALLAPIMHHVDVTTHFFHVPNRLIWNDWEKFITGGEDGTAQPLHPTFAVASPEVLELGSLADYLGLPVQQFTGRESSFQPQNSLPFRAYQLIYNEYYRDQNLTDPVPFSKNSGNEYYSNLSGSSASEKESWLIRQRAWQKDYFSSALPWTQRGPQAGFSIGDSATISPIAPPQFKTEDGLPHTGAPQFNNQSRPYMADSSGFVLEWEDTGLKVDLEGGSYTTINELRRANKLQEWLEKNARGGARYIEQIFSHFGVKSSDARLQRPEYLGGSTNPVMISEVLQNSQSTETSPQGTMAGHGVSATGTKTIQRRFEEHGIVLGIMSVMPKPAYMQGINRMFLRRDKFDYFWPEFAHLGEQAIQNQELFADGDLLQDTKTFGYAPRYSEYRYMPSSVHGDFRTNMDYWHMARKFENRPHLNNSFVSGDPTNRVFAVKNHPPLLVQTYCDFKAVRPIPKYATPLF